MLPSSQILEQLSPKWAEMCRQAGTTEFIWAHDGSHRNGWVRLLEGGHLETKWNTGHWGISEDDPDIIDMSFGSSRHICHYKEGGFLVEDRIALRTGKSGYKPETPRSVGWIKTDTKPCRMQTPPRPKKRKEDGGGREHTDRTDNLGLGLGTSPGGFIDGDSGRPVPRFAHKDFTFALFASRWLDCRKKSRLHFPGLENFETQPEATLVPTSPVALT